MLVVLFSVSSLFLKLNEAQASAILPSLGWGLNTSGQLGIGNSTNQNRPIQMTVPTGIEGWTAMYPGNQFTLARTYDNRLFGWGINANGQLGLPGNLSNQHTPQEISPPPGRSSWAGLTISQGVFSNFALTSDGELYGWGQGNLVGTGSPSTINYTTPQPVPVPAGSNRWVSVYSRTTVSVGLTDNGRLFAWGWNDSGQIGIGSSSNTGNFFTPQLVPVPNGSEKWVRVFAAANHAFALTDDNRLFGWGRNANGELGIGNTTNQHSPHLIPLLPGTTDWAGVTLHIGLAHTFALTPDHRLFAWGRNVNGNLAQGNFDSFTSPQEIPSLPGMANWNGVEIISGGQHGIARTPDHRLFAWGWGLRGQLALGADTSDQHTPQLVVPPTGHTDWRAFDLLVGTVGHHTFAFVPFATGELELTKVLEKPYGTPNPVPLTFSFRMVAHSFNNDETQAVIDANFPVTPTLDSRDIARTITIDSDSDSELITSATGNIVELSGSTNILEGIEFSRRGVYSWIISELPTTTPAVTAPSNVVFSQAQYELRVYVRQKADREVAEHYVYAITVYRLRNADGSIPINDREKVGMNDEAEITFTNTYTRRTGTNQHLSVEKYVEGTFANLYEAFTFTATINRHPLCQISAATPIVARVFDASNTEVATHNFTVANSTVNDITLRHGYRLVFDPITIGSKFEIIEAACLLHIASADVFSHTHPTIPLRLSNSVANQARSTDVRIIGNNRNAALFNNEHQSIQPTGLILGASTYFVVPLFGVSILTAASFAGKARKRIEDLPAMH